MANRMSFRIALIEKEVGKSKQTCSRIPEALVVSSPGVSEQNQWFGYEPKSTYYPIGVFDVATGELVRDEAIEVEIAISPPRYIPSGSFKQIVRKDQNGIYWFKAIRSFVFGKIHMAFNALSKSVGSAEMSSRTDTECLEIFVNCEVDVDGNVAPSLLKNNNAPLNDSSTSASVIQQPEQQLPVQVGSESRYGFRAKKINTAVLEEMVGIPSLKEIDDEVGMMVNSLSSSRGKKKVLYNYGLEDDISGTTSKRKFMGGDGDGVEKKRACATKPKEGHNEIKYSDEYYNEAQTGDSIEEQTVLKPSGMEPEYLRSLSIWLGESLLKESQNDQAMSDNPSAMNKRDSSVRNDQEDEYLIPLENAARQGYANVASVINIPSSLTNTTKAIEILDNMSANACIGQNEDLKRKQLRELLSARRYLEETLGRFFLLK